MKAANGNTIKTSSFETTRVDGRKRIGSLRRRIRTYERRYETSSADMLKKLSAGEVRETAEMLKWMQAYHALRLLESETPTGGTPTTTTGQSTKNA